MGSLDRIFDMLPMKGLGLANGINPSLDGSEKSWVRSKQ